MKRLALFVAVGALVLGAALPAVAQPPAAPTVSFSGEFRVFGIVTDNLTDYKETEGTANKDSFARYTQRLRLFTTVQSADKKAKAVWGLEVGDVTWGSGGGANGPEYGGTSSRTGPGSGGELGADGVAVETKHLYIWFEVPGVPQASLTVGIQNITLLATPSEFLSDDAAAIKLDLKFDPIDLQLFTAKAQENTFQSADDVDFYGARLGVNVTKDLRVTLEGLLINGQCVAKTTPVPPATTGTCISHDVGDTFWVGGTVGTKIADMAIDAAVVYGQRTLSCPTCGGLTAEESGYGAIVGARVPVGPLTVNVSGWYTSGDDTRAPGISANGPLTKDSDKLPTPEFQGSWYPRPLIAEAFAGHQTIGGPGGSPSPFYAELAGTYGVGASALFAVMPALQAGGGVAYVGASDANGIFGDSVIEIDLGAFYSFNANLGLQLIASYLLPDKGDDAWAIAYRLRYAF